MKKFILSAVIIGALSSNAIAADDAGTAIPTQKITMTDCSLLTEDVKVNLSSNVFGAYACNTTRNIIGVATCHPGGRKGNVSVSCSMGDPNANPAVPADPGCTAGADGKGTKTVQGGIAYQANSGGGQVTGTNAQNCKTGGNTIAEAAAAAGL